MSTCLAFPGHGGAIAEAAYEWSRHSAHARRLLQQAAHETGVPVTHMTHASGIALRRGFRFNIAECAVVCGRIQN